MPRKSRWQSKSKLLTTVSWRDRHRIRWYLEDRRPKTLWLLSSSYRCVTRWQYVIYVYCKGVSQVIFTLPACYLHNATKRTTTDVAVINLVMYPFHQRWHHSASFTLWTVWISRARYRDVIIGAMASQITSLAIVYSTVYSGADQRKHQSSASLAFVWGIHRWPVNSRTNGQ